MFRKLCLGVVSVAALLGFADTSQAGIYNFTTVMTGPNEFPVNASPGTGTASFQFDDVAHTLTINATFQGLTGTTTAAHIHAPTTAPFFQNAGVATQPPSFATFPLGVTSGVHNQVVDLSLVSSWQGGYLAANGGTPASAEQALLNYIFQGRAYYNIHSSTFGGGEIRGFLVPEPASAALAIGAAGLLGLRRRRAM
jgi:hypothetical protein